MKFLTEYDLRKKYQENPFDDFTITKEIRLTPEARQYLIDRKVKIRDEKIQKEVFKKNERKRLLSEKNENPDVDWFQLRCEVLKTAALLEKVDLLLAQELCALEKCLAQMSQGQDYLLPSLIQLKNGNQVSEKFLEDRLSNVSIYLQLPRGAILIQLYSLYFAIRKMKNELSSEKSNPLDEIATTIGQLIAFYLAGGVTQE